MPEICRSLTTQGFSAIAILHKSLSRHLPVRNTLGIKRRAEDAASLNKLSEQALRQCRIVSR